MWLCSVLGRCDVVTWKPTDGLADVPDVGFYLRSGALTATYGRLSVDNHESTFRPTATGPRPPGGDLRHETATVCLLQFGQTLTECRFLRPGLAVAVGGPHAVIPTLGDGCGMETGLWRPYVGVGAVPVLRYPLWCSGCRWLHAFTYGRVDVSVRIRISAGHLGGSRSGLATGAPPRSSVRGLRMEFSRIMYSDRLASRLAVPVSRPVYRVS